MLQQSMLANRNATLKGIDFFKVLMELGIPFFITLHSKLSSKLTFYLKYINISFSLMNSELKPEFQVFSCLFQYKWFTL